MSLIGSIWYTKAKSQGGSEMRVGSGVDSEPCTGEQLPDSEKVIQGKSKMLHSWQNLSDDQVACSVLRAEGRHLSRGLQQGAPQTGETRDGLMLALPMSILKWINLLVTSIRKISALLKTDILLQLCSKKPLVYCLNFLVAAVIWSRYRFPPPTKMDLKSPKSPGWKNKFETLTRRRPRDDQDDIMAELDIMTENLRQIEVHILWKQLRKKS